jgi:hypothetical protein
MKYEKLLCATGTTSAVLLAVLAIGSPLAAQEHKSKHSHYTLVVVDTFGGPHSSFNSGGRIINRSGTQLNSFPRRTM